MTRVRVKICGLTRPADARAAAAAGADAVGLVFYERSPRAIDVATARAIGAALPPFVARVALFLDAEAELVQQVVAGLAPDLLQFHGRETPAFCRAFARPYIKSVPMGETDIDPAAFAAAYADASAFILDANRAGEAGGLGTRFDWRRRTRLPDKPLIVAGGLDAASVGAAIARFAPYAVDVSSGVESAPGVKDSARMQAFTAAVANAGAAAATSTASAPS